MSDNSNEGATGENSNEGDNINKGATGYHRKMNEKLDDLHETMKENLRTLPDMREQVTTHSMEICSLVDPGIAYQVEQLDAKIAAATSRIDANLLCLEGQRDAIQMLWQIARAQGGGPVMTFGRNRRV